MAEINENSNLPVAMVELPEMKVIELLRINQELREENVNLRVDLATVFVTSLFFTTLMDSPISAITEFLRIIKNPKKYEQVFKPMFDVLKKHPELAEQVKQELKKRGVKV